MELRELVGGDEEAFPWARALLLALALQLRSGLLLLGLWLGQSAGAFPPVLGRLRLLPAHPDWYLSALVQNLAVGVVLVWIIRRLAIGWAVALAAIAGSLAWLSASALVSSSPLDGFVMTARPVSEAIDTALLLASLAASRALMRSRRGVLLVSTTAATLCGVTRFTLTNSVWGAPWNETWRIDLVVEALSGTAFGLAVLLLATVGGRRAATPRPPSLGLYVGAHGLAALTLVYLQLALRFAEWRPADSPSLLWSIGGLTVCGYVALLSLVHAMWAAIQDGRTSLRPARAVGLLLVPVFNSYWIFRALPGWGREAARFAAGQGLTLALPSVRLLALYAVLELCAAPFVAFMLGDWPWVLSLIAALGLLLLRGLGTLVVSRTHAALAVVASARSRA